MKEDTLYALKKLLPTRLFEALRPAYHYAMAAIAALCYWFPSRHIFVIAVTGTKGKTSTIEILNAILEEAGYATALSSTLRFKVNRYSENNLLKMTTPGRFFVQRFLRRAVREGCDYAIIEMTSEGAKQFRHRFIAWNALIFTNITPEHIESHGSFEKYLHAKLEIAAALEHSKKTRRFVVVNADDEHAHEFLAIDVPEKTSFRLKDAEPFKLGKEGADFTLEGVPVHTALSGAFNLSNILAAATFAKTQNIAVGVVRKAIERFSGIRGRVEHIEEGQNFTVVVDYAHTPDSLEKVYQVFQNNRKICVLGGTGGGRDKGKRAIMGNIADAYCGDIILTNEDPYDENPNEIVAQIREGITHNDATIIMDRREAIARALKNAQAGDAVIITGKGTDPYIMGPDNTKLEWDDARVAREELKKLLNLR
jgi:UDP-N-acetylmuramoyl-L-alanyl-D-glutamate--2,6-diaminopimelate ligase